MGQKKRLFLRPPIFQFQNELNDTGRSCNPWVQGYSSFGFISSMSESFLCNIATCNRLRLTTDGQKVSNIPGPSSHNSLSYLSVIYAKFCSGSSKDGVSRRQITTYLLKIVGQLGKICWHVSHHESTIGG